MNNTSPALSLRGFMLCYHQMHDFLPWFGPNPAGLRYLLDAMAEARLNALLVEYETYFPWSGDNSRICAKDHLTEGEVAAFNEEASARGIEIIPLVQVLGHVYHILIHKEYKACAEDPDELQQLCPLSTETFELAKALIDDTLRLHPGCRHLHIGGDECRMLGHCPRCEQFVRDHGVGRLFASYMRKITDYVLSKGVIPIMWHDIAMNHPQDLKELDPRVLFNFWHYGSASHGDGAAEYARLLKHLPASRVIGSPGARSEAGNGALHHIPSLEEANILQLNRMAADSGAIGTILTDWPDTGTPFYDSFFALRMQGEAAWDGGRQTLLHFRHDYAAHVFGCDAPEFPAMLDAIAGSTLAGRGFQFRNGNGLNRYDRRPFEFAGYARAIRDSHDSGEGTPMLYRQIGQLTAAQRLAELVAEMLPNCRRNRKELEWYGLLARTTELFLTIDIALRKECFVTMAFGTPTPEQITRFESRAYARRALELWDGVIDAFRLFHKDIAAAGPLERYCRELFPAALKEGLARFVVAGL